MIKLGQLFSGNIRNVVIEKTQFSLASQIPIKFKTFEAIRNPNTKYLSSIAIPNLSYSTKYNSSHNVTKLNKSTDAKNISILPLVDKKGQHYSKEDDKKLMSYVNEHGKGTHSLKALSEDIGRSYVSIRQRIKKIRIGQ